MKKLICALVLLAMLVPVAAMAAAPAANISMKDLAEGKIEGKISFSRSGEINVSTEDYTAVYHVSGALRSFDRIFENVVMTSFMPDGTVESMIYMPQNAMWHEANGYWFGVRDPEGKEIPELSQYDPYKMGADQAGEIPGFKKATTVPPDTLKEVLKMYKGVSEYSDSDYEKDIAVLENGVAKITDKPTVEYVDGKFKANLGGRIVNSDEEDVVVLVYGRPADFEDGYYVRDVVPTDREYLSYGPEGEVVGANGGQLSIALIDGYAFTIAYTQGSAVYKTAFGPVKNQGGNYRINGMQIGNTSYYDAVYLKNGDREVYFMYGDTYKTQTAYDDFNRMASHEYWDSGFTYWRYSDGVWESASNGGKGELKPVKSEKVSDEALRSLALTKVVAEYGVEPATSVSKAEAGLPIIIDNGSALGGASIEIESQINDEETTTFEISPMKNGEAVQLASSVQMYLPLPNGFDATIAKNYGITIDHEGEIFSTMDGSAEVTDNGILVTAISYSPYKVMWGVSAKEAFDNKPVLFTEDIKKIPEEVLNRMPSDLRTADKIVDRMESIAAENGYEAAATKVFDVTLKYLDADGNWVPVTAKDFPEKGILVELDLPKGTNTTDYDFFVVHMFTTGEKAGTVEMPKVMVRDDKICVRLTGLSPVSVSWKVKGSISVANLPSTGDTSNLLAFICLLAASAGALLAQNKRRAHQ